MANRGEIGEDSQNITYVVFTKGNIQNVSSDASGNKHGENETERENYRDKLGNENVKPQNISNWKHIIFSILKAFVESIESKVSR